MGGLFYQWFDRTKFKDIFRTHWESFKELFPRYRSARYDEVVQKMLGCGDPENGYATYVCGNCGGDLKKVSFSCKSSFCLSCVKVYTDRWAARIEATQEKLERLRFSQALDKAAGAWKDNNHPHLKTQGDINQYLREIRVATNQRLKRGKSEPLPS